MSWHLESVRETYNVSDIWIDSPQDSRLDDLSRRLVEMAPGLEADVNWPAEQLGLCAQYGVFRWFIPTQWGGQVVRSVRW